MIRVERKTSEHNLVIPYGVDGRARDKKESQGKNRKKGSNHTSYCPSLLSMLSPDEENHVPLGGIDIVVLKEEDLVYAILLKRTELDE
jgi:hypothetical protein